MARKANGKRSVSRDGSVRVHGKASNGEGLGTSTPTVRGGRRTLLPAAPGRSAFVARRVRKRSLAEP